eukprot:1875278-Amphidinium_carterae.3
MWGHSSRISIRNAITLYSMAAYSSGSSVSAIFLGGGLTSGVCTSSSWAWMSALNTVGLVKMWRASVSTSQPNSSLSRS